jgi:hypothetical protein
MLNKYPVIRNPTYDFSGQSYATSYPNLHKYPATMIPQIGIGLFKELNLSGGKLLDPYCGSGSSFTVGLDRGLEEMDGFDLNPLAILICKAKFTKIPIPLLHEVQPQLQTAVANIQSHGDKVETPDFYNIDFWFSKAVTQQLAVLRHGIDQLATLPSIKNFLQVPFSETVRECSYTRNNEFKLYRLKAEELLTFQPDVLGLFWKKLSQAVKIYETYYYPKLTTAKITLSHQFRPKSNYYDVVLTSPPYGDSKTTVAYGQFSLLSNEWLGIKEARQIDKLLMGGQRVKTLYSQSLIQDYLLEIAKQSEKRALEVSAFYFDLAQSIQQVAQSIKIGGKIIYVVGNRRVKNIQLPTDQFIAEQFEKNGFKHLFTYERLLGNKAMPLLNSPTNQKGERNSTMTQEFIIVGEKLK